MLQRHRHYKNLMYDIQLWRFYCQWLKTPPLMQLGINPLHNTAGPRYISPIGIFRL